MAEKASTPRQTNWAIGLVALTLLPLGCRERGKAPDPAADRLAGCRSACAALTMASADAQPRCVSRCGAFGDDAARSGCDAELRDYLGCVSRAAVATDAGCEPASCLEQGRASPACATAHATLRACLEPCSHAGSVTLVDGEVDGGALSAELVRAGCSACPAPAPGAAAGSACQAASVCAQTCCACPDGRARFLLRACVGHQCQSSEAACRLARERARVDPCTGVAQRR
jgi:hypothetical protein